MSFRDADTRESFEPLARQTRCLAFAFQERIAGRNRRDSPAHDVNEGLPRLLTVLFAK